ncbi:Isochorismatase-like [Sphingobium cupriresistens]
MRHLDGDAFRGDGDAEVEDALASNKRLVAARDAGVPVIFTNLVYEPGGADGGMFFRKAPALRAFPRGSPDGAFPDTLQPRANEMGVDTVMVTGFTTSVAGTSAIAVQLGQSSGVSRTMVTPWSLVKLATSALATG